VVHLEDKHVGNTQAAATAQAAAAAGTDVSQYVFSCCFFFTTRNGLCLSLLWGVVVLVLAVLLVLFPLFPLFPLPCFLLLCLIHLHARTHKSH